MAVNKSRMKLEHEAKTRIDDELATRLRDFASKHYRSESAVLRLALRFYLDAEEKPV